MKLNFTLLAFISCFCFSTAFAQVALKDFENKLIETLTNNDWKLAPYGHGQAEGCPATIAFAYDAENFLIRGIKDGSEELNFDFYLISRLDSGFNIIFRSTFEFDKITVENKVKTASETSSKFLNFYSTTVEFDFTKQDTKPVKCAYEIVD